MFGGGLMHLVAYGRMDCYIGNYARYNKITYGKTNPYMGKNNFYKKLKKSEELKKEKITKKSETNEKNKVCNITNKSKHTKNKKTDTTIFFSTNFVDIKKSNSANNLIRIFSIKLYIRNFILEYLFGLKKNIQIDDEMFSEIYIKIYLVLILIVIKTYNDNNTDKNIQSININNIDSSYFLNLKNYISSSNKNMDKLIMIIKKNSESYLKKIFNIKNNVKLLYDHDNISNQIINNEKNKLNNQINSKFKIKNNNLCIITLEDLENKYFYCSECNTKYSPDGFLYWSESNNNCCTPWCTNLLSKFYFCIDKMTISNYKCKEILNDNKSSLSILLGYYEIISSV